jgi:hypothetical protein
LSFVNMRDPFECKAKHNDLNNNSHRNEQKWNEKALINITSLTRSISHSQIFFKVNIPFYCISQLTFIHFPLTIYSPTFPLPLIHAMWYPLFCKQQIFVLFILLLLVILSFSFIIIIYRANWKCLLCAHILLQQRKNKEKSRCTSRRMWWISIEKHRQRAKGMIDKR